MTDPGSQLKRPPGPSMHAFWDDLLEPLIAALRPETLLEIGADRGTTTRALLRYAAARGAVVHSIDPKPAFDVAELEAEYGEAFVFHRTLSLRALPELGPFDFALIDGDHNWHTVLNELRLLERRATDAGAQPPLVALHDVGWPYGRRDLYYDPDSIPAEKRRPFARRAIHPDSDELVDEGLNGHLANAVEPAAKHSGVLGAIEDFVAESELDWRLFEVQGEHGLGVLAAQELLDEQGRVADLLESTQGAAFLAKRVMSLERARVEIELRRVKARGASTPAPAEQPTAAEERDDAERQIARLRRQRDAADAREVELEDELAAERRKVRRVREQLEDLEARQDRRSPALAQLQVEADSAREDAESAARATEIAEAGAEELRAKLDEAVIARARLVADFEESRESLERTIDDLRAQSDTGRHAAAELRELLEERGLEVQRFDAQMTRLQTALGRARAEAEIARSESSALERRLEDLAVRHEVALAELGLVGPEPLAGEPPSESGRSLSMSEPEAAALRSFTSEYRPLSEHGIDPLALPAPHDRRGVLRGPEEQRGEGPSIDVVVCVHNALEDVRRCLWSLVHKATHPFHLIVVDDGSDEETSAYLAAAAVANPKLTLIENRTPPHGYTIAANLGMRSASGDYVVVLNSDTIVTFEWLERIVACGESDARIGILGPLSNAASHQSVPELRDGDAWATNPLPPFVTEDGMAKLLDRVSPRGRPRLPFINGFCYVVKRAVYEAIGYFDEENFASGYCEENDFSYRAAQAGFELAVVDDAYVFHAKSKSFTPEVRKPIAKRNYKIFLDKHGAEEIEDLVRGMEANASLKPLRCAVSDALSSAGALAGALNLTADDPLEVVFILPGLGEGGSGGSHSVYQEVKGMRELGVPARIVLPERAWKRARAAYEDADDIFETFADADELAERSAAADVISATHFKSVAMLADLRSRRDNFLPAYYVQDYEPFFTSNEAVDIQEAVDSYTAIPGCLLIAKTHWLCNIVGDRHGRHVAKVEPSIDELVYRAQGSPRGEGHLRVVAMLRPRTPRRQPTATVAVLEALRRRFGEEVELVTFGCDDGDMASLTSSVPLLANHEGLLTRHEVAELLNGADVFLDMSMYQAFGRTALEAMACGCTAVVPRLGGVWEFVEDGVNAIAVDTLDPGPAIEALSALVRDRDRLRAMQEAARRTAKGYTVGRAALSEYLIFSQEHARRFGHARAAS